MAMARLTTDAASERAGRFLPDATSGSLTPGGVTPRVVAISFVLLVAVAAFNFYVEMLWKGGWDLWMVSSGCPAMTPVFFLFLLTAAMSLPRLRRSGLTRRELLAIYAIVLVGAPVVTYAVLPWLLVKSIHYYYFVRVNPYWSSFFLSEVPPWFAPNDTAAVTGFFEGQSPVPWAAWSLPLAAWSSFMLALFGASLCLVSLVQRPWIASERLTFPIAQVPLTMVEESGGVGRLSLSKAFWVGAAIAFALHLLTGLSERIPAMPQVTLGPLEVIPWQRVGPLAGLGGISLLFWPWLIAIAYLIPKDLSFSVWFFWLGRLGLTVAAVAAGATPQRPEDWYDSSFPAPYYQGTGAALALAAWVLWGSRRHLVKAARSAFGIGSAGDDVSEPLRYRWAVWGFLACCAFMVLFIWLAGCRVSFALSVIALVFVYFIVWARIRAETGLGLLPFPIYTAELMMVPFGSRIFSLREIITLISLRWAYYPGITTSFEVFPSTILESYKIADAAGLNSRRLAAAIAGGFVLSLAVGLVVVLTGIYHYGWFGFGFTQSGWLSNVGGYGGGQIVGFLTDPRYASTDINGLLGLLAGGVTAIILGLLRLRFWWWPFHPIGYVAANTWGLQLWYLPFFIGWLAKTLVVRYAGLPLYRRTIPLAVGLIVGDLVNSGLWGVLRLIRLGAY